MEVEVTICCVCVVGESVFNKIGGGCLVIKIISCLPPKIWFLIYQIFVLKYDLHISSDLYGVILNSRWCY